MMRGHLIVFEGVDGSGTTTQAEQLRRRFAERGLPAHVTAQPSKGPVGSLIRQVLTGRLVLRGSKSLGWSTMALLFAADRQDHQESEIEPNLRDSVNVICDRYVPSSVIYQSVTADWDEAADWILELNRHIRQPDLVFHLKVSPEDAMKRRERRTDRAEIYDDPRLQQLLAEEYDRLGELIPDVEVVTLDGSRSVEEVAEEAWTHVERLRAKGAPE
jgi:dTMP kinase